MSDYRDGYSGLMRPGGGDWTSFNAGVAHRHHDAAMGDMTARHNAEMEAGWAEMNAGSANGGMTGISGGGPLPGGDADPFDQIVGPVVVIGIGIVFVLFIVLLAFDKIDDALRTANAKAAHQRLEVQYRLANRQWRPLLNKALREFDPARDLDAIDAALGLSLCHRRTIGYLIEGGATLDGCLGESLNPPAAPIQASIHYDRFVVGYETTDPIIEHRLTVMPLNRATWNAPNGLRQPSPVEIAREQLGGAGVAKMLDRRCLAISADRVASNLEAGPSSASDQQVRIALYGHSVSIACPARRGLQIAASRAYRP